LWHSRGTNVGERVHARRESGTDRRLASVFPNGSARSVGRQVAANGLTALNHVDSIAGLSAERNERGGMELATIVGCLGLTCPQTASRVARAREGTSALNGGAAWRV
jgi:hypothetical protein